MTIRIMLASLIVFVPATSVYGQMKVSSTQHCAKPTQAYNINVGDRPGHAFAISQMECTWTNLKLGGVDIKSETSTCFAEDDRERSLFNCYSAISASDSAKYFGRWQGAFTQKDGKYVDTATLSIVEGPSSLKGLKGKWTCKTSYGADGSSDSQCEGEYKLPK